MRNKANTHARFVKPGRKPKQDGTTIEPGSGRDNEVPAMPEAAMYGLTHLDEEAMELVPADEWPEACKRAWSMIFTSELASSYVESDRLQAEAAVLNLAHAVDPLTQPAQRRQSLKEYQAALEKLGLNPSARSKFKISIATEEHVERKSRRERDREVSTPATAGERKAPYDQNVISLYERHRSTGPGY